MKNEAQNKTEQKKPYSAPEMEIVEINHQENLLECSPGNLNSEYCSVIN